MDQPRRPGLRSDSDVLHHHHRVDDNDDVYNCDADGHHNDPYIGPEFYNVYGPACHHTHFHFHYQDCATRVSSDNDCDCAELDKYDASFDVDDLPGVFVCGAGHLHHGLPVCPATLPTVFR